jgi:hypothetical protein
MRKVLAGVVILGLALTLEACPKPAEDTNNVVANEPATDMNATDLNATTDMNAVDMNAPADMNAADANAEANATDQGASTDHGSTDH